MAVNLANNIGASIGALGDPSQNAGTLLSDTMGRSISGLFGSGEPSLQDPAALMAEAQKLFNEGDRAGAAQLINLAKSAEASASQATAREQSQLTEASPAQAQLRQKQFQAQEKAKQNSAAGQSIAKQLRKRGLTEEADLVLSGKLSPKEGYAVIASREKEDRNTLKTDDAKRLAKLEAMRDTRSKAIGIIQTIGKTNPKEAMQLAKDYPIPEMADNEIEAAAAILNSRMLKLAGGASIDNDDGPAFQWERGTPHGNDVAYGFAGEIENMIEENDAKGDSPYPFTSSDTMGYEYLMSSAMESVRRNLGVSETVAAEDIMQFFRDNIGVHSSPEALALALENHYSTVVKPLSEMSVAELEAEKAKEK